MVARLVKYGTVQVTEGGVDVVFGEEGPPTPPGPPGFLLYRNGVLEANVLFSPAQLTGISLGMAAYDGQIGQGSMVIPGLPGWLAGDRITFTDLDGIMVYMGFIGDWSVERNDASPSELQTVYHLMDTNRQWIGRRVVDWLAEQRSYGRFIVFLATYMPDLTLDTTWVDPFGDVEMPARTYTGDGIMDLGADLILYTANTFFMRHGAYDGAYEVHFHALWPGPVIAGIIASDDPLEWDYVTVFPLTNPTKSMSASDLKNTIEAQNGVVTVPGSNAPSIARHNAGGLKWEAVLQYSVNEIDLGLIANNILDPATGAGEERATYSFTIQRLRATDLLKIPAGSAMVIHSDIVEEDLARISLITLTVTLDGAGNPLPGFWDAHLEVGYPFRHPAAVRGYGGQGGDAGRLAAEFAIADHINVVYSDLGAVPVGGSIGVIGYLFSEFDAIVVNTEVPVFWTLEQWQDEAETFPSTAWSIDFDETVSTPAGTAANALNRVSAGAWTKVRVTASL